MSYSIAVYIARRCGHFVVRLLRLVLVPTCFFLRLSCSSAASSLSPASSAFFRLLLRFFPTLSSTEGHSGVR